MEYNYLRRFTIGAGQKSRGVLDLDMLVPLPAALGHLVEDEANNRHGGTGQRGQHQELEPVDDALVVEPANTGHAGQQGTLDANIAEHLPYHPAQENEVHASRNACADDEGESHIGAKWRHPYRVERICDLGALLK